MNTTTLRNAKSYEITLQTIKEFLGEYGWTFVKVSHIKRQGDFITAADGETETEISIEYGKCPTCEKMCVSYGWAEGGNHLSTCECKTIDFG